MAATAVSTMHDLGLEEAPGMTLDTVIQSIIDDVDLPFTEGEGDAERAILERLAKAETEEELFGELGPAPGWGTLLDVPVEVTGFRLLPSNLDGAKVFAVVQAYRLDEGEPVAISTSAKGVLIQLIRAVQLGFVPGVFKAMEVGKETKGRNRAQRLVRLGNVEPDHGNPL